MNSVKEKPLQKLSILARFPNDICSACLQVIYKVIEMVYNPQIWASLVIPVTVMIIQNLQKGKNLVFEPFLRGL